MNDSNKRGRGRPKGAKDKSPRKVTCNVLTEEVIEKICCLVAKGNFRYFACSKLGVNKHTFQQWITVGNKQVKDFSEGKLQESELGLQAILVQELEKAEADAHDNILSNILDSKDVKAHQWFLERRYPKLYRAYPQKRLDDEEMEESDVDAVALLADRIKAITGKDF
jgi:hypothetical protein